jgi:hypothetical protein
VKHRKKIIKEVESESTFFFLVFGLETLIDYVDNLMLVV